MLEGWKDIANHLEFISGRRRSRFTLMRWAQGGSLPVKRDPSNRPYADSEDLTTWWINHKYVYASSDNPEKHASVVYFLRDLDFVKIGFSSSGVNKRIEALQTGNPREIFLIAVMPGTPSLERELHARFDHLRVRGEWFRATEELLQFVSSLQS